MESLKKRFGILLFLLLFCALLPAGALAATNGRVVCSGLDSGLKLLESPVAEITRNDSGVIDTTLTVKIDVKNTNWNELITLHGLSGNNFIIRFTLNAPEGYTRVEDGGLQPIEPDDNFAGFDESQSAGSVGFSVPYGRYVREIETFTFTTEPPFKYLSVRWYKENGEYLTEHVTLNVIPASDNPQSVRPNYPTRLLAAPVSKDVMEAVVLRNNQEVSYYVNEGASLTTRVQAPADARKCVLDSWQDYAQASQTLSVDGEGYISISSNTAYTNESRYRVRWLDQDDRQVGDICAFVVSVKVKGSKPAIANLDYMVPLGAEQNASFALNATARQIMEVERNYNGVEGWMNIRLKGKPSYIWNDKLDESGYVVTLQDVDASRVKSYMDGLEPGGTNNIFYPLLDSDMERFWENVNDRTPDPMPQPAAGSSLTTYTYTEGLLKKMIDDGRIAVYTPYLAGIGGYARVFLFFDEDGNRIHLTANETEEDPDIYFLAITLENASVLATLPVPSEAAINGRVDRPIFVAFGSHNWKLQSKYDVQCGVRAYQVELTMLDENGAPVDFSEQGDQVFYLPYPENMSYESGATWTLRHYLDDSYSSFEFLDVTATENGLRFETDSLSPFVLLWDDADGASSSVPPKTGDDTPLALYAALLTLAAAAFVLLRRRASAN